MTRQCVLIADDDPEVRATLVRVVETDPGLEVVASAGNAAEAIGLATRHQPDVALLDLQPHHSLCRRILPATCPHVDGLRCQNATRTGSSLLRIRWDAVEPRR